MIGGEGWRGRKGGNELSEEVTPFIPNVLNKSGNTRLEQVAVTASIGTPG